VSEISDFGNGNGYLYETNTAGDALIASYKNTKNGARNMRQLASVTAPVAANRSAFAIIQVDTAGSTGNLTVISVNGVNQIAANVPCASSNPLVVAPTWAAAINAFTPASGFNFTAFAIDDLVYLVAPAIAGAAANGLAIIVTTDTGTLTATVVQQLINGSSDTGVYDTNLGRRFWINAATDAIPNPTVFTSPITEITKYVTNRGMQTGMPTEAVELLDQRMPTDRYSTFTTYVCNTEASAATDTMIFINPTDFVESDVIFIRGADSSRVITIESAPTVSASLNPNIYLNNDLPYTTDTGMLMLQYAYTAARGGHFVEQFRGVNGSSTQADYLQNTSSAADYIKNRPDYVMTYAQVETLRAASGLRLGARYNLSDRSVIVTACLTNALAETAIFKATYGGVLHEEFCIYNFLLNRVITRVDYLNNRVTDTTGVFGCIASFPFGNAAYTNNVVIDSPISFSSTATAVSYNTFINVNIAIAATATVQFNVVYFGQITVGAGATCRSLSINAANFVGVGAAGVLNNVVVNGTGTSLTVNGQLTNSVVDRGTTIIIAVGMNVAGVFQGLIDTDMTRYAYQAATTYIQNVASNISYTADFNSTNEFTDTTIKAPGTVIMSNVTGNVDVVTLGLLYTPVIFRPFGTTTVTINDFSVSSGNMVLFTGVTDITLNGTNGDYAVFEWSSTAARFFCVRVCIF
jgi:hypothetical protein